MSPLTRAAKELAVESLPNGQRTPAQREAAAADARAELVAEGDEAVDLLVEARSDVGQPTLPPG